MKSSFDSNKLSNGEVVDIDPETINIINDRLSEDSEASIATSEVLSENDEDLLNDSDKEHI